MDPAAVEQARERLERAEAAAARLDGTKSKPADLQRAWSEFLIAASGIYSKLEQGAKISGESKGWFGKKVHERKKDPLLRYIHAARNTDEHGLAPITKAGANIKVSGKAVVGVKMDDKYMYVMSRTDIPDDVKVVNERALATLQTVIDDRYNDRFDPPREHLGKPVADLEPSTVAALALEYLRGMVAEAAKRAG